jgi:hypothetical protein
MQKKSCYNTGFARSIHIRKFIATTLATVFAPFITFSSPLQVAKLIDVSVRRKFSACLR